LVAFLVAPVTFPDSLYTSDTSPWFESVLNQFIQSEKDQTIVFHSWSFKAQQQYTQL
jgi:hypothetical protein